MIKAPWRALSAFALLAAIACGGDDGTEPEGSISVSASPATLTLPQGGSGTVTVTLTRGGGFAEPVTVSVEGAPTGVTASVSPASLTGTATQATVTVNVASTVQAGSYPITVRASATGIGAATAQYTLVVTAAPTANYTLSATAASVAQGGSGTSTVSIQRTNFTGAVALTLDNPPAGITGTFNPASATGDNSVLTINVAGTVNPGTVNLTVKGTATGIADKTATVALTVTAAANYTLSASPAALTIAPGGNSTTTVNINRTNFTGTVNLTADAPPTGITASFNPAAATGNTSTATINVAGTVVPGPYTLTIKGTATGIADKTTTVALTVGAGGTFTVSASPATLTMAPGTNQVTTITIVRTNLTADIALSLVNPPTGITGTFTPATLTGAALTSSLQVTVAGTVQAGTYPLTVQGVGGSVTQTTTVNVTVAPAGTFTISASPTTLPIAPGANATSTITVARTNLTADIALSLVNPPTGITGTFTPATLTGATLTSSLQVNVAGTVQAGTYPLTVQGVAGTVTQTTTVTVTVAASSVTLSIQPTSLSIQQGGSSTATLTVNRTNFTGNVTPSYTGNPAGLTLTFNPNPITGNTAQVTVNVGASTPTGTHTITITGAAGAAGNPTATLSVQVTAPTGGSNFNWDFCTADGVPLKFWRLSGGTWAEVSPTVVGNVTRFSFSISSTSGGVAYTMQSSGFATRGVGSAKLAAMMSAPKWLREKTQTALRLANQTLPQTTTFYDTQVYLALTSEIGGVVSAAGVCDVTTATVNKVFNVTNLGASEAGELGYGPDNAGLSPSTTSYTLSVPSGSYDWAAVFGPAPGLPDFSSNWTSYRLGRNEAAPGAGAVSINRTGATAFTSVPFTLSNPPAGALNLYTESIEGSRGSIVSFPIGSQFGASSSGNILFFAPADRLATDLTSLDVFSFAQSSSTVSDLRLTTRYFGAPPASATITLAGPVPAFTVSQTGGLWSAAGTIPAEYQTSVSPITASFSGNGDLAILTITATRGWLTANSMATSYTLTQPSLPNFLSQWQPAAPLTAAGVFMFGYDLVTPPTAGTTFNGAGRLQTP